MLLQLAFEKGCKQDHRQENPSHHRQQERPLHLPETLTGTFQIPFDESAQSRTTLRDRVDQSFVYAKYQGNSSAGDSRNQIRRAHEKPFSQGLDESADHAASMALDVPLPKDSSWATGH